ncbi:hypothetical protein Cgig2_002359 [Carnegiea gigantea]|uniref:Uncharacterized protein n=1 Tax=Carnegiea gigantea TaxID=171969 RepID=A0A9Q1KEB9_9CARY|nr:hypothetical protein Cgig2_002359 [Carnegiea gigantea]
MGFPSSLMTGEMVLYILDNFEWYRREVVCATGPMPYDYEELCPDFDLVVAEEYAQIDELPKLPQVVFMVMLQNDTVKLGVLSGRMITVMESVPQSYDGMLFRHGLGVIGVGSWRPVGNKRHPVTRIKRRVQDLTAKLPLLVMITRDEARLVVTIRAGHSGGAARDFNLREMVQATFYAMLLNDAVGLGIASGFIAADLKVSFDGLQWTFIESWMHTNRHDLQKAQFHQRERESTKVIKEGQRRMSSFPTFMDTTQAAEYVRDNFCWSLRESSTFHSKLLPLNFHSLCPNFNLLVVIQFVPTAYIPQMVQAIFYAMVLNEAAELGLSSKAPIDRMTLNLRELKWDIIKVWLQDIDKRLGDAQVRHLVETLANPQPLIRLMRSRG